MTTASAPPCETDSLVEAAIKVLLQPDPWRKAEFTYTAVRLWREGSIKRVCPEDPNGVQAPDRPARSDETVRVCPPGGVPKRGKGGTLASRQALLHSAVHIENWAVDLSWDIIARFGLQQEAYGLPHSFFDDFVTVAEDECRHFSALAERLKELGSHYGAFPAHDGLWESAATTSHSLPARLAVEHCVHEARGLDVLPGTIAKFVKGGDMESAALLRDLVYPEEITHCAAGVRWLTHLYNLAHGQHGSEQQQQHSHTSGCNGSSHSNGNDAGAAASAVEAAAAAGMSGLSVAGGEEEEDLHHTASEQPSCTGTRNGSAASTLQPQPLQWRWRGGDSTEPGLPAWAADALRYASVESWFQALVRAHFWGLLKPPFNEEARAKAGFGKEWYEPLTVAGAVGETRKTLAAAATASSAAEAAADEEGAAGGSASCASPAPGEHKADGAQDPPSTDAATAVA